MCLPTDSIDILDLLALVLVIVEGILFEVEAVSPHDEGVAGVVRFSGPSTKKLLSSGFEDGQKRRRRERNK